MFKRKKEVRESSSIEKMEGAAFPILQLPFNGTLIFCKVRCLNSVQMKAIGEFYLIDISKHDDKEKETTIEELIEIKNWQEALIKETLIEPTFEEIQKRVYGKDNVITERKVEAKRIENLISTLPAKERGKYEKELNSLKLFIGCLFPDDFMNAMTQWATGAGRGDIKKLSREILLEAAILASNGHDNPTDHLGGDFLELHIEQINRAAWIVYTDYLKEKEIEKSNTGLFKNMRKITGGRVK